jgi:hypothetical protein
MPVPLLHVLMLMISVRLRLCRGMGIGLLESVDSTQLRVKADAH